MPLSIKQFILQSIPRKLIAAFISSSIFAVLLGLVQLNPFSIGVSTSRNIQKPFYSRHRHTYFTVSPSSSLWILCMGTISFIEFIENWRVYIV